MTSGRPAPAAALALVLSGVAVVLPLSATQRPTSGATSSAPEWLDEAPTSRVSTMHLLAETDPLDGPVPADGRVTLVLRVTPRPGMRIYAHDATGYVPFTLRLDPTAGAAVDRPAYPVSTWYEFPPTRERSRVYQGPVTIRQRVLLSPAGRRRLAAGDGPVAIATLRYQACDDRLCYRPTDARIAWLGSGLRDAG
jgi:DsbC/DsbD-like thiol-disulfide interchange protein